MTQLNVYHKLNDSRVQFHKLQLKKTGFNKFAGYQYFELGDFLIPALQVLHDNGLCAYISFGRELATMTIVSVSDGSKIELTSPMANAELKGCHPIQNLGAVETYTRRYLWVAALEIVEHDALDSSAPVGKAPKMAAMDGIGDNLPTEDKEYLLDLAASVTELVESGKAENALHMLREQNLDPDARIFVDRHLASNIKTAIRKAGTTTKE